MISQNSCLICQKTGINPTNHDDGTNLKQQLLLCVPEINWNCSEFPPYVCELCTDNLKVAVDFRQKCLEKYETNKEPSPVTLQTDELKKKLLELKPNSDNLFKFSKFKIGIARRCYSCIDCRKLGSSSINKILSGRIVRKRSKKPEVFLPLVQDRSVNVSEDELLSSIPSDTKDNLDLEQKLIQYYKDTVESTSSIESFNRSTTASRDGNYCRNPFMRDYSKSTTEQILQDLCTIAFPLSNMRPIFGRNRNYKISKKRPKSFESSRRSSLDSLITDREYQKYKKHKRSRFYTPSTYSIISQRSRHSTIDEGTLKCNICRKEYKLEKKYVKHMLDKHGIHRENLSMNKYSCSDCHLKFFTQNQLDKHSKIHSLGTTYKCNYCDRCFVRQINLNKHLKSKHVKDLLTFGDQNRERKSFDPDIPRGESQ